MHMSLYLPPYIPDTSDKHVGDYCLVDFKEEDYVGVVPVKNI